MTDVAEFEQSALDVDDAVGALAGLDPDARAAAERLQAAIEGFHRDALVLIVQRLKADPRGKELLFELVDEPAVRAVFALHGIIRPDPLTRAKAAVDTVRPYLQSHGGDVEVVGIEGSTLLVRLEGSCSGCSMSAVTLAETVTSAVVGVVDEISDVRVLEDQATTSFIPLDSVKRRADVTGWTKVPSVTAAISSDVDEMVRFDVGDESFVATVVGRSVSVFRNECVHQGLSLDGGSLADGVVQCPWHGFRFDATSGECITAPGAQLTAVPARIDDGVLWIRTGS